MLLLSREFASPGMSASADRFSHWLMLGHHDVYWGCTSLAQEMMVAYASLISRNWALPSPRRQASRKCWGNMWGEMKESKKSHVSFGSRTLAWDMRMKSWWHVNSWMRSRTGFPSAWRGGDNSIASIALRYVLDAFILIHFTYLLCLDTKPSISSLNRWLTGYYQWIHPWGDASGIWTTSPGP